MVEQKYAPTPLMQQYYAIKAQYPDALLLFRAGDFYETFGDDAVKSSSILGITLTKRANGAASSVPLAGFPYHAIDNYLDKLVAAGQRVAICEQLEDPKKAKGIVKRGVTELVTPGVTYNENILRHKENTYLAAVYFGASKVAGAAFLDISTGEFYAAEGSIDFIVKILTGLAPKEILYSREQSSDFEAALNTAQLCTYRLDEWAWQQNANREKLLRQLSVTSLKGFGVENMTLGVVAAGAVLHYLDYTKHCDLKHIDTISRLDEDKYVWIDRYSMRNLELFHPLSEGGTALVDILDRSTSPMGGRMLRRWLSLPLRSVVEINRRGDVVEYLTTDSDLRDLIRENLASAGDPERIVAKVAALRATPRDISQLAHSIGAMNRLRQVMNVCKNEALKSVAAKIEDLEPVRQKITTTIMAEPAALIGRGAVIGAGVDTELDELRAISNGGKRYLDQIVEREARATGITSLKISYNNVFGYYIEVRNTHKDKVPATWIRKQTLVAAERYITEELKEYEEKILGAEGRISEIESRLFSDLIMWLQDYIVKIKNSAAATAEIDTLLGFALTAIENRYCRAKIIETDEIHLTGLRHPVIEKRLPIGEPYIPSDIKLNSVDQQIIIITGPNMAGKSAMLRSVALCSLMAQCGSFVACDSAEIGLVDRIFTRVGASDNITSGESTFMVEMLEASNILNNVTDRSLILLDEIGRGTSTYDGISIAWAIVEYLHGISKAKALFATHYHEIGEMESMFDRIKNYNVSVREIDNRVIFLRKLVRGAAEHSFGIHVARMAGMPAAVVKRAQMVLSDLESQRGEKGGASGTGGGGKLPSGAKVDTMSSGAINSAMQLSFFQMDDPTLGAVAAQIRDIDINALTPLEALNKLSEIKKLVGNGKKR